MSEEVQEDPISESDQSWIQLHAMFANLRSGGFTISEAAAVIVAFLAHHGTEPE